MDTGQDIPIRNYVLEAHLHVIFCGTPKYRHSRNTQSFYPHRAPIILVAAGRLASEWPDVCARSGHTIEIMINGNEIGHRIYVLVMGHYRHTGASDRNGRAVECSLLRHIARAPVILRHAAPRRPGYSDCNREPSPSSTTCPPSLSPRCECRPSQVPGSCRPVPSVRSDRPRARPQPPQPLMRRVADTTVIRKTLSSG